MRKWGRGARGAAGLENDLIYDMHDDCDTNELMPAKILCLSERSPFWLSAIAVLAERHSCSG